MGQLRRRNGLDGIEVTLKMDRISEGAIWYGPNGPLPGVVPLCPFELEIGVTVRQKGGEWVRVRVKHRSIRLRQNAKTGCKWENERD